MTNPPSIDVTQLTSLGLSNQEKSEHRAAAELPLSRPAAIQGLYAHIPFCFHKCHYCDFFSIVDHRDRQDAFVRRFLRDLQDAARVTTGRLRSIFIGGGTPSLLRTDLWQQILPVIHDCFDVSQQTEFTIEANPETVSTELLDVLVAGGVNRLSIGAQSFHPHLLTALERWHDPANVARSVACARAAGIDNVNLDLIFAIPGQSLEQWRNDLDAALSLQPDHLSCYGLMYEPNTPLTQRLQRGQVQRVDEDVEAAMYEHTIDRLGDAGFDQYEISNWARPGRRCAHNLLYWMNGNWWACGPGGAAHVDGWRWKNAPRLDAYIESRPDVPIQDVEHLDKDARTGEMLMLRLRLLDGISLSELDALLNASPTGPLRRAVIDEHIDRGMLERRDGTISLSRRGLLLADSVIAELL